MKIATLALMMMMMMMTRKNRRNSLNFHNMVFIIYRWQVKVVYDIKFENSSQNSFTLTNVIFFNGEVPI